MAADERHEQDQRPKKKNFENVQAKDHRTTEGYVPVLGLLLHLFLRRVQPKSFLRSPWHQPSVYVENYSVVEIHLASVKKHVIHCSWMVSPFTSCVWLVLSRWNSCRSTSLAIVNVKIIHAIDLISSNPGGQCLKMISFSWSGVKKSAFRTQNQQW